MTGAGIDLPIKLYKPRNFSVKRNIAVFFIKKSYQKIEQLKIGRIYLPHTSS